jgi:predicted metalloendopeptidase
VALVEGNLGEALGKLYVAEYFPPERKARMDALVKNLLAAYKQSIDSLDWMSPATKLEAQAKLAKFTPKIGYPSKWRDYSAVDREERPDGQRAARVLPAPAHDRQAGQADRPRRVGHDAADHQRLLQLDHERDRVPGRHPAAAVLRRARRRCGQLRRHRRGDRPRNQPRLRRQGSQSDGDGNLRDWWTAQDRANFKAKADALVKQYDAYSPLPGYNVNGALTLGENIADNSGVAIAYKAYKLSLGGKTAPVIDGFTGDQRFFMGWGQLWRVKMRERSRSCSEDRPAFAGPVPRQRSGGQPAGLL